jgi:hypothetical protein
MSEDIGECQLLWPSALQCFAVSPCMAERRSGDGSRSCGVAQTTSRREKHTSVSTGCIVPALGQTFKAAAVQGGLGRSGGSAIAEHSADYFEMSADNHHRAAPAVGMDG